MIYPEEKGVGNTKLLALWNRQFWLTINGSWIQHLIAYVVNLNKLWNTLLTTAQDTKLPEKTNL